MSETTRRPRSGPAVPGSGSVDDSGQALSLLNSHEASSLDEPDRLVEPPVWGDPGPSVQLARGIGEGDGKHPGFDVHTRIGAGTSTTPHQDAVRSAVQAPLDRLARRGERVRAASEEELGAVEPTYPKLSPLWRILAAELAIIGVAGLVEFFIGRQQWERLLGDDPTVATAIALGVVALLGIMAWIASLSWFHQRPGVLREHGTKLFGIAAVLLLLFAAAMAYSFAGGVATPTTGGVSGGGSATATGGTAGEDVEWIRWVIYTLMTLIYGWTVVIAHLWHSTMEDRRRVRTYLPLRLAAERASIDDPGGLLRLRAATLRAIGNAWLEGVDRATVILTAYYAGVRLTLDPALLSSWDHRSVSAPTFTEPDWLRRLDEAAALLEEQARGPARASTAVDAHRARALPSRPATDELDEGR